MRLLKITVFTLVVFGYINGFSEVGEVVGERKLKETTYEQVPFISGSKIFFFDPLEGIGAAQITPEGALLSKPRVLTKERLYGIPYSHSTAQKTWFASYTDSSKSTSFNPADYGVRDQSLCEVSRFLIKENVAAVIVKNGIVLIIDGNVNYVQLPPEVIQTKLEIYVEAGMIFLEFVGKLFYLKDKQLLELPARSYDQLKKLYSDHGLAEIKTDLSKGEIRVSSSLFGSTKYSRLNVKYPVTTWFETDEDWTVKATLRNYSRGNLNVFALSLTGDLKTFDRLEAETVRENSYKPFQISNPNLRGELGDFWQAQHKYTFGGSSESKFIFDINKGIAVEKPDGSMHWMVNEGLIFFPVDTRYSNVSIAEVNGHSLKQVFKTALTFELPQNSYSLSVVLGEKNIYVLKSDGTVFNLGEHSLNGLPRNKEKVTIRALSNPRVEKDVHSVKKIHFGIPGKFEISATRHSPNTSHITPKIALVEKVIHGRRVLYFSIPDYLDLAIDENGNGELINGLYDVFSGISIEKQLFEGKIRVADGTIVPLYNFKNSYNKVAPKNKEWRSNNEEPVFTKLDFEISLTVLEGVFNAETVTAVKPKTNANPPVSAKAAEKPSGPVTDNKTVNAKPKAEFKFARPSYKHLVELTRAQEDEFNKHFKVMNKALVGMTSLELEASEVSNIRMALLDDKTGSAVILGDSGSGKSKLALGVLMMIAKGQIPSIPENTPIVKVDASTLAGNTKFRGESEERIQALINWAVTNDAILFMDEMHTLKGSGTHSQSSIDDFQRLKSALSDYGLRALGTTTSNEWLKYFAGDEALERRFKKIRKANVPLARIPEYLNKEADSSKKPRFNAKVLQVAIDLSQIYAAEGSSISKAGLLVDSMYAFCRDRQVHPDDFTEKHVIEVASFLYNLKKERFDTKVTRQKLAEAKTVLDREIVGQHDLKTSVIEDLKLGFFSGSGKTPNALHVLVGPEGVGKSTVVKNLAELLGVNFKRINLGNYLTSQSGELLKQEIAKELLKDPFSFIFLDEIEKSHPAVQSAILDFMDSSEIRAKLSLSGNDNANDEVTRVISTNKCFVYGATNAGRDFLKTHSSYKEDELREAMVKDNFQRYLLNRFSKLTTLSPSNQSELRIIIGRAVVKAIRESERSNTSLRHALQRLGIEDAKGVIIPQGLKEFINTFTERYLDVNGAARRATTNVEAHVKSKIIDLVFELDDMQSAGSCNMLFKSKIQLKL